MKIKPILTILGFSLLFFASLSTISDALLWDFNSKAQEADWKVISGVCEIDKDTYKISDQAGEALAIAGESNWTDYTIACKARLTQPGGFNNIAIAFRASDDGGSEYMFMLEGGRQQAEWWKKVGGTYTSIKVDPLKIDTQGWFSFKVVVKGQTFEGYYEDKLISAIEDKELKKGKVGARIYGCTSHIDDFDVNGPDIPSSPVEAVGKLSTTWGKIKN
ncbi:hypothetical protein FJZ31_37730 [Candidatus Poribacteria bacterium]|nr:hypothetical protein [Candidatus Poribacteria bacterium]